MSWQEKINRYCLWLTVAVVPWQLRHILIWANHQGEFFEYASVSIYLSDILIGLVLLTWLCIPQKSKFSFGPGLITWPLSLLIIWMWISVWYSQFTTGNWIVGINNAAHFSLFYLFYFYLINQVKEIKDITLPLLWGVGVQAVVAIGQYLTNHSLGLKYLGESVLDPAELGIPVVLVDGVRHLRAHGTLPHANILGGYLAASLPWVLMLYTTIKNRWRRWLVWGVLVAGVVALLFSFSRTAWLAGGVAVIIWGVGAFYYRYRWGWLEWFAAIIICGVMLSQYLAILSRMDTNNIALERESVVSRVEQLNQSHSIYGRYAWTGVGIGQYTLYLEKQDLGAVGWHYDPSLPGWAYNISHQVWDYQPVHNLWLMVLAELGWVGEILLILLLLGAGWVSLCLIIQQRELVSFTAAIVYLSVLLLGLFDHYLWTLQPGRLILFLSIGMIAVLDQINRKKPLNYE